LPETWDIINCRQKKKTGGHGDVLRGCLHFREEKGAPLKRQSISETQENEDFSCKMHHAKMMRAGFFDTMNAAAPGAPRGGLMTKKNRP
jgi:hypothetical protein